MALAPVSALRVDCPLSEMGTSQINAAVLISASNSTSGGVSSTSNASKASSRVRSKRAAFWANGFARCDSTGGSILCRILQLKIGKARSGERRQKRDHTARSGKFIIRSCAKWQNPACTKSRPGGAAAVGNFQSRLRDHACP